MRLPRVMRWGWAEAPQLRVLIVALVWLSALCWVAMRAPRGATGPNPIQGVVTSPAGFLPSSARSVPGSALLKLGRVLEAGVAPLPAPSIADVVHAPRRGMPLRKYRLFALVAQPLWFLVIYASFIAWAACVLTPVDGEQEAGSEGGFPRAWARVLWVGLLWMVLLEAARYSGLYAAWKLGRLESLAPNRWAEVVPPPFLAALRVLAVMGMCASAVRGGLFWRSARDLAGVFRRDWYPVLSTVFVGGLLLLFYDWAVKGTEVAYWPHSNIVGGLLGLMLIATRAVLAAWLLASLLIACQGRAGAEEQAPARARRQGASARPHRRRRKR